MASPYDPVFNMFDIPRYEGFAGSTVFPRREAPQEASRRAFLEGAAPATEEDQEWELAMQSPDPMGVMEEIKRVREERDTEDLLASIAELDPMAKDYLTKVRGTMAQNPKGFLNPAVGRILDFQSRMAPPKRPAPAFQYPQFQSQYQKLIAGGADPQAAADEVQMAEQQYGLQRQLAASGLPFDSPELMTDNRLDELKVLQTLAKAKADSRVRAPQFRVPSNLSEELEVASLARDPERIAEAVAAIDTYQQELARLIPQRTAAQPEVTTEGAPVPPPAAPAAQVPAPATPQVAPQRQAAPPLQQDKESEDLWSEYLDLENTLRVDSDSTNPSDSEADRELRGEMDKIQSKIMSKLKIPDTKEGRKLFDNVWLGRKNSLDKTVDSKGEFLREPLRKTGVTGNSWVIRPA
jgi:hypothetical protein